MLKHHIKVCHSVTRNITKTRPTRIAAKRANEFLATVCQEENGPDDVEWIAEDDIDLTGLEVPAEEDDSDDAYLYIPICSLENHFSCQWEEEK